MLGQPLHGWLIPRLNSEVRLRKPPLAYWMTAGSFSVFGVGETAGRLPTALCAWLIVLFTWLLAREVADEKVATVAGLLLLGSYMFFRFGRLAETDPPASLGVLIAIYCWVRAHRTGRRLYLHVASLGLAISMLSKGMPTLLAVSFILLYTIQTRTAGLVLRWITSGAFFTFLFLALPWFVYVLRDPSAAQIREEIGVVTRGDNHFAWPWNYAGYLLIAILPWVAIVPAGIKAGIEGWKERSGQRVILLGIASLLIPLLLIGNKQPHYLQPLLPFVMILLATAILRGSMLARGGVLLTCAGTLLGAPAVLAFAHHQRGIEPLLDVPAALLLALAGVVGLVFCLRRGHGTGAQALAAGYCLILPLLVGKWIPSVSNDNLRESTQLIIGRFGNAPMAVLGGTEQLSLAWDLRRPIPEVDPATIETLEATSPGLVLVTVERDRRPPPVPPQGWEMQLETRREDKTVRFYTRTRPSFMQSRPTSPGYWSTPGAVARRATQPSSLSLMR